MEHLNTVQPSDQQGYPLGPYPYPAVTQQPAPYVQPSSHTTVVLNQQPVVVQKTERDWSSGLCDCFEDCGSLLMCWFCPCCLLSDVASKMGESCWYTCCCPGSLLGLRIALRVQENIRGSLCNDYCVVNCCGPCVLCQLARELKYLQR